MPAAENEFPHGFGDPHERPRNSAISLDVPFVKYDEGRYSSREYIPTDGSGDSEAAFRKYFNAKCYLLACTYAVVVFSILAQGLTVRRVLVHYGVGKTAAT